MTSGSTDLLSGPSPRCNPHYFPCLIGVASSFVKVRACSVPAPYTDASYAAQAEFVLEISFDFIDSIKCENET